MLNLFAEIRHDAWPDVVNHLIDGVVLVIVIGFFFYGLYKLLNNV